MSHRITISIVTGILFILTLCAVDSILGSSFPVLSFLLALPFKAIFIGVAFLLALLTKASFGRAAEVRPRLLALVQERLTEVGISLAD